jgi:ethanolamine utilization protein EutN
MRIAWVTGKVTLHQREPSLRAGALLICEALDETLLELFCNGAAPAFRPRAKPAAESLVVHDTLGAGVGDLIAVSEGPEAANPFRPAVVPLDAGCAAILDHLSIEA